MNHWEHKTVGVAGECDTVPSGAIWEQAKAILAAKAKAKAARQAKRDATPVPNTICYAQSAFKNWKPGDKVPACKVCGGLLHPTENHVCDGYKAKYVEHTPERKERWEAEREEIRETRRLGRGVFCTECGDLLADPDEAQWHFEDHGGKPEREHYALDGEPDGDLDGYEDEPEEDYCEGDDDGYDCD
jgi:hypothetical protein